MRVNLVFLSVILFYLCASSTYADPPELLGVIHCDTNLTEFGHRIIPAGDQNGDGYDDMMIWERRRSGYLFHGGDSVSRAPVWRLDSVNSRANNIGDVNGDTFDDFAIPGRSNAGWKVGLYFGGPLLDTICDQRLGLDGQYPIGYTARGHDINASGTDELISWSYTQKAVLLFELGTELDSIPDLEIPPANCPYPTFSFGESIVTGDFNGDGTKDLAVSFRPGDTVNGSVYLYWGDPGFDTIPDMIIRRPGPYDSDQHWFGYLLANLGDFSGDGYDDMFVSTLASPDSTCFVFFGGPQMDTLPDITFIHHIDHARAAGDINHDGHNDLIVSYDLEFSTVGDVSVYFGGPEADGEWDVQIHNNDIPGYQKYFGMDCAGIGDYNGDGIDDFAFSAIDSYNIGHVYIYAGWDSGTDVTYEYEPNLPSDFTLSQNYPNPFNMSTTIEFSLPRRSHTTLIIYNILGERLRTLISGELPVGSYTLSWDGSIETGSPVASGVYLYEMRAGEITLSEKMVVLK